MRTSPKHIIEIDPEFLKKKSAFVTEKDINAVKERTEAILSIFEKNTSLRTLVTEGVLLAGLIKDYASGKYRAIPWWAISAVAFTLLYVFNPLDLIPDTLPLVGYLDDATVVTACMSMLSRELTTYRKWKLKHPAVEFPS
jgi:uncharacterized membrane protein YkvA (DUF1232 family)